MITTLKALFIASMLIAQAPQYTLTYQPDRALFAVTDNTTRQEIDRLHAPITFLTARAPGQLSFEYSADGKKVNVIYQQNAIRNDNAGADAAAAPATRNISKQILTIENLPPFPPTGNFITSNTNGLKVVSTPKGLHILEICNEVEVKPISTTANTLTHANTDFHQYGQHGFSIFATDTEGIDRNNPLLNLFSSPINAARIHQDSMKHFRCARCLGVQTAPVFAWIGGLSGLASGLISTLGASEQIPTKTAHIATASLTFGALVCFGVNKALINMGQSFYNTYVHEQTNLDTPGYALRQLPEIGGIGPQGANAPA